MSGEQLTIQARDGRDTNQRILRVAGPLMSSTSHAFLEQVRVETSPVVILDMASVDDIDSNGVGTLAKVHMSFQREDRRLAVVGLTPKVHRMLEVTRVLGVLTVYASEAEAEDALVSVSGTPDEQKRSNP
jgi:anti-sigma B factor antagonist